MPTSDTPPAGKPGRRGRRFHVRGFTLLELVVVLALLGLVTALVAPSGLRMIGTWRRATDVQTTLGSLSAIGINTHRQGRGLRLEAGAIPADVVGVVPDGWSVVLQTPLQVQANGACGDARGELRADDGYVQPFEVRAPFCRAVRTEAETQ